EQLVVAQRLETDAFGRPLDLNTALPYRGQGGPLHPETAQLGPGRGLTPDMAVRDKGVRIEALEVGEAPRLVRRRRQRQRTVALEQLRPTHGAYLRCRISELPSGSSKKAMLHTPE